MSKFKYICEEDVQPNILSFEEKIKIEMVYQLKRIADSLVKRKEG